jgi:hypothetical protein
MPAYNAEKFKLGHHRLSILSLPVPKLWAPRPCAFCKGGYDAPDTMGFSMPSGLHRTYGAHHLHFITCSCYRRLNPVSDGGGARSADRPDENPHFPQVGHPSRRA